MGKIILVALAVGVVSGFYWLQKARVPLWPENGASVSEVLAEPLETASAANESPGAEAWESELQEALAMEHDSSRSLSLEALMGRLGREETRLLLADLRNRPLDRNSVGNLKTCIEAAARKFPEDAVEFAFAEPGSVKLPFIQAAFRGWADSNPEATLDW